MAIEKEKLFQYFLTHYLSRQEVLFKLPLSISIDTFWPELMNRRKARASVLSLYDPAGKPYWYVLTDKMVAASERLCEEAMNQEERFDPYRASMTSAMTEEMFFTSFVEGAQIQLQEAMDFLGRGTGPEDVQEQMIWNNRQAWGFMIKSLYKPMDETFVKSLAFMLTDEMDGRADDYRQTDHHPIAAMHNEQYEVTSATLIPERMREYCEFLQSMNIPPLIKAAVGQAFLLAARPFAEGNERLSRMISTAVLLRSGYDFFRDISISSMIARENYRYYQAMCDTIRPENGSDLTYFIEYYLDLLARALELKKEHDRNCEDEKNKEMLEREHQMARQSLEAVPFVSTPQITLRETQCTPIAPAEGSQAMEGTESALTMDPSATDVQKGIREMLVSFGERTIERKSRIEKTLANFLAQGIYSFSREQWQRASSVAEETAQYDCSYMVKTGMLTTQKRGPLTTYDLTIKVIGNSEKPDTAKCYAPMRQVLKEFQQTGTDREKRIAALVEEMLKHDVTRFTHMEWCACTSFSKSVNNEDLRTAANYGWIEQTENGYRICERVDQRKRFQTPTPMLRNAVSILLNGFSDHPFSATDTAKLLNVKPNTAAYCLEQLTQKGILLQERDNHRGCRYLFSKDYLMQQQEANVSAPAHVEVTTSIGGYTGVVAAGRSLPAMQL